MIHVTPSSLPPDPSGCVLDKLAGLEHVIDPDVVRQILRDTGRVNLRSCKLTHEITLWIVLAMGLFTHLPIRQVFKAARSLFPGEFTPTRSALCMARQRLGHLPLRRLFTQVVRPLAQPQLHPQAFYAGRRLVGIDGTVFDVPDTPENDHAFGRPKNQHGQAAFPQIQKLALVELGTHVELAFTLSREARSEQMLLPKLIPRIPEDALLLLDAGFYSYAIWEALCARGIKVLARMPSYTCYRILRTLSDGSALAKLYRRDADRKADRGGILVRVIRYTLDDPQRVNHGVEHLLMTNLLDEQEAPARELIELYHVRWEQELVIDEQKTHQDPPRPTKPTHLRSQTPLGVVQEVYGIGLAHFATRALMVEAAVEAGVEPLRLSFTGCFQVLVTRLPESRPPAGGSCRRWVEQVLWEMGAERLEARRNRINPRVIKRRFSKWPRKKPIHRNLPPLKKTFMETVVMMN
jgi:hypothetical protein